MQALLGCTKRRYPGEAFDAYAVLDNGDAFGIGIQHRLRWHRGERTPFTGRTFKVQRAVVEHAQLALCCDSREYYVLTRDMMQELLQAGPSGVHSNCGRA